MKTRPIIFSGPMVRAILAGQKYQTRRVVTMPRCATEILRDNLGWIAGDPVAHADSNYVPIRCPYGHAGDQLWVRETATYQGEHVCYRADGDIELPRDRHWKPSIFMPRWASRITLAINSVRAERLMDITAADSEAEGVERNAHGDGSWSPDDGWIDYDNLAIDGDGFPAETARDSYRSLWESIHGPGSWVANPYVWVITFSRITA